MPDVYSLNPGVLYYDNVTGQVDGFSGSVELGQGFYRTISSGSLTLTPAQAPVPEASTTVSLSLLLALGAGAVVAARKKKTTI